MIHPQALVEKLIVRGDHVVVVVLREMSMPPVAGLRGFSVADAVGKNDEVAIRVQELSRTEELTGKLRLHELLARTAGAVANQNGVCDAALRVQQRLPKRGVVQAQLRENFDRLEFDNLVD